MKKLIAISISVVILSSFGCSPKYTHPHCAYLPEEVRERITTPNEKYLGDSWLADFASGLAPVGLALTVYDAAQKR